MIGDAETRSSRSSGHVRKIEIARDALMAGKIVIEMERCKGCGLCITVCPRNCIVLSQESNKNGYFPAQAKNTDCTGCTRCAIICPEGIIEVYLEEADKIRIVTTAAKTDTPHLIEEKR
jgi:2-oxoglutarate ferredoxin oxidoreductase subunit delta